MRHPDFYGWTEDILMSFLTRHNLDLRRKSMPCIHSSLLNTAPFMYYFAFLAYAAKELLGIMLRDNIEGYAKNWFITLTLRRCYQICFSIHCGEMLLLFSVKFLKF